MFTSILNIATGNMTVVEALLCTAVSQALGLIIAFTCMSSALYTTSPVMLPVLVQIVIMTVND